MLFLLLTTEACNLLQSNPNHSLFLEYRFRFPFCSFCFYFKSKVLRKAECVFLRKHVLTARKKCKYFRIWVYRMTHVPSVCVFSPALFLREVAHMEGNSVGSESVSTHCSKYSHILWFMHFLMNHMLVLSPVVAWAPSIRVLS